MTDSDTPRVRLRRILTHFHFDQPSVSIEQNPFKESTGVLTGAQSGRAESLFPGKASFSQFLYLTIQGRTLANRDALVMTAERVDQWPPIGSSFVSERPTDFYDVSQIEDEGAQVVATLAKCAAITTAEFDLPLS